MPDVAVSMSKLETTTPRKNIGARYDIQVATRVKYLWQEYCILIGERGLMDRRIFCGALIAVSLLVFFTYTTVAETYSTQTTTFLDVWQGDSALLEDGNGYEVLIDGGKKRRRAYRGRLFTPETNHRPGSDGSQSPGRRTIWAG